MLTKLTLRNFQPHEKLVIDTDSNVLVLTGPTDIGKTSIYRALEWLFTNTSAPLSFITHGADSMKVTVEIDGHQITRARSKDNNSYRLDDQEYKAFGQNVPEPIAKLLNVSDVNFQGQYDAPWWFSNTAGEVSRHINSIINLGVIDGTLAHLNATVRKTQERIAVTTERLNAAEAERESLKSVRQNDTDLKTVEAAQADWVHTTNAARLVRLGIEEVSRHDQRAKNASAWLESALAVYRLGREWEASQQTQQKLQLLVDQIRTADAKAEQRPVGDITHLKKLRNDWLVTKNAMNDLRGALFDHAYRVRVVEQAESDLAKAKAAIAKYSKRICPTCKRPL